MDGECSSSYDEYARFFIDLEEQPNEPVTAQLATSKETIYHPAGCGDHNELAYRQSAQEA